MLRRDIILSVEALVVLTQTRTLSKNAPTLAIADGCTRGNSKKTSASRKSKKSRQQVSKTHEEGRGNVPDQIVRPYQLSSFIQFTGPSVLRPQSRALHTSTKKWSAMKLNSQGRGKLSVIDQGLMILETSARQRPMKRWRDETMIFPWERGPTPVDRLINKAKEMNDHAQSIRRWRGRERNSKTPSVMAVALDDLMPRASRTLRKQAQSSHQPQQAEESLPPPVVQHSYRESFYHFINKVLNRRAFRDKPVKSQSVSKGLNITTPLKPSSSFTKTQFNDSPIVEKRSSSLPPKLSLNSFYSKKLNPSLFVLANNKNNLNTEKQKTYINENVKLEVSQKTKQNTWELENSINKKHIKSVSDANVKNNQDGYNLKIFKSSPNIRKMNSLRSVLPNLRKKYGNTKRSSQNQVKHSSQRVFEAQDQELTSETCYYPSSSHQDVFERFFRKLYPEGVPVPKTITDMEKARPVAQKSAEKKSGSVYGGALKPIGQSNRVKSKVKLSKPRSTKSSRHTLLNELQSKGESKVAVEPPSKRDKRMKMSYRDMNQGRNMPGGKEWKSGWWSRNMG